MKTTELRCPKCGAAGPYYRRKTGDYACKRCPAEWARELRQKTETSK